MTQVGHSAVRRFVMGEAALERAATEDEIAEMVRLVEEAMDAGAAGVSSSQAPHQRGELGEHIPSFFADDAETRALAEAVRRKGKRLLSINPATKRDGLNDEDRALLVELAEISGAVVSWNDFGMGTPNGDSALEFMEAELQRGREIYASGPLPAPRDALHAEEALGALRELRGLGRVLPPRPAGQARGARRPRVARPPGRVLGDARASW